MAVSDPAYRHLPAALESGAASPEAMDASVRRVLEAKVRMGVFDAPYVDEDRAREVLADPAHRDVARIAAERGRRLIVDATSSLFGEPIDLDQEGIDFVTASAAKCVQAIPGVAFVLARRSALEALREREPRATVDVREEEQYRNMGEVIERHPEVIEAAVEAVRRLGVEPVHTIIRGGTDGSRLSFMGLPCPNIFAGEHAFHSRLEWVSVQDMEKAVQTIVHLAMIFEERA